jgi:hypothetical protein
LHKRARIGAKSSVSWLKNRAKLGFGGKYLAPKKQHRLSGHYRSTLTGQIVYGKPKL